MAWKCFMMQPLMFCERYLRRYSSSEDRCPNGYYHNAMVRIPEGPLVKEPNGCISTSPADWDKTDPRWPEKCDHCDYKFTKDDSWQLFFHQQFKTVEDKIYTIVSAPIGAMWNAEWLCPHWAGPDGQSLCVKLPPGGPHDYWNIDGPSPQNRQANAWQRTGTPPLITVSPSILTPKYHGWLRDGELTEDVDGKKF